MIVITFLFRCVLYCVLIAPPGTSNTLRLSDMKPSLRFLFERARKGDNGNALHGGPGRRSGGLTEVPWHLMVSSERTGLLQSEKGNLGHKVRNFRAVAADVEDRFVSA